MTQIKVSYVYDTIDKLYVLIDEIKYYSPRYKKWKTCPAGYKSDGASGPAPDLSGISWWIHDVLCEDMAWDDGTPCTIYQSSMVIHDILKVEGRPVRACTWFMATLVFGYVRKVWRKIT